MRKDLSRTIAAPLSLALLSACASTGATFRSGVGDAYLEHAPYYAGTFGETTAGAATKIGHLPIAYQRGASDAALFDPRDGSGSDVERLLDEMNAYLDSLGASTRLVEGRRTSAVAHEANRTPPDVRFGCAPHLGVPGNECAERGDSALGRGNQTMQLAVGRPSAEWIAWNREIEDAAGATRTLVITLEVAQYLVRQDGWRGTKVLELGTMHKATLPWLTSLETPVTVLQLTGALVDQNGKALRIGAEGFHARRTRFLVSAAGGRETLSDDDVRAASDARRDDLPGKPLAWQIAMRQLVTNLTGREPVLGRLSNGPDARAARR